jgi:hypothetical protein
MYNTWMSALVYIPFLSEMKIFPVWSFFGMHILSNDFIESNCN